MYAMFFILIYHIVFVPTCVLTEFTNFDEDKFYLPLIAQGLYYSLTIVFFILLLKRPKKKVPQNSLLSLELPFCA